MNEKKLTSLAHATREKILHVIDVARRGHIGSAFSIVEILVVLYEHILRIDPQKPRLKNRDRFILSKGHGCLALYVILAKKGFITEKVLDSFCAYGSILGGHPQYPKVAGVEATTGSLGHGMSIGIGMALAGRIDRVQFNVYVLLGDGECDEGTVWEAALSASKYKLDNVYVFVDYNKMQCYGSTFEVLDLEPMLDKWKSFGFDTREVNGHNAKEIYKAIKRAQTVKGKPHAIICHTVKGKGLPSIENAAGWHHKAKITDEDFEILAKDLRSVSK